MRFALFAYGFARGLAAFEHECDALTDRGRPDFATACGEMAVAHFAIEERVRAGWCFGALGLDCKLDELSRKRVDRIEIARLVETARIEFCAAPETGAEGATGGADSRVQSAWISSAGQPFQSRSASFRRSPTLRSRLATSTRIAMGTSLGALAALHAHCRYPGAFDALFLQSGSFFCPRFDDHERWFRYYSRIVRFVASAHTFSKTSSTARV